MTASFRSTGSRPGSRPITLLPVSPATCACCATGASRAMVNVWNQPPAAGCSPTAWNRRARYAAAVSAPGLPVSRPPSRSSLRNRMSSSGSTGGGDRAHHVVRGAVPICWAPSGAARRGPGAAARPESVRRADIRSKNITPRSARHEVGVGGETADEARRAAGRCGRGPRARSSRWGCACSGWGRDTSAVATPRWALKIASASVWVSREAASMV